MTETKVLDHTASYSRHGQPLLDGDRYVEFAWMGAQMPTGTGACLDVGCGRYSPLGLMAALKGWKVVATDLQEISWDYLHPRLMFFQKDVRSLKESLLHFQLILNCSTMEHVGLAGRYGVQQQEVDGDLEVMESLLDVSFSNTVHLLTVPVGKDDIYPPLHRIYGDERLPLLLKGWKVHLEYYWVKRDGIKWELVTKEVAMSYPSSAHSYAIGCFRMTPEKVSL